MKGRSLQLFFVDGRPDGMLTAEVFNWTGHVLKAPRLQIDSALARDETARTGVYLLLGEREETPLTYIGEAEDIRRRLKEHVSGKDWWTELVIITTAGNALHKAHVKYLEARLIEIARDISATVLDNNTAPARPSLSEADQANMESFLDTLGMVLPAIGIDAFLDKRGASGASVADASDAADNDTPLFELTVPKTGAYATAKVIEGEFIVEKGSKARKEWSGVRSSYTALYQRLIESKVLQSEEDHRIFTRDYAFASPSAAAAIVTGRSANGPLSWRVKDTEMTYRDWEEARING